MKDCSYTEISKIRIDNYCDELKKLNCDIDPDMGGRVISNIIMDRQLLSEDKEKLTKCLIDKGANVNYFDYLLVNSLIIMVLDKKEINYNILDLLLEKQIKIGNISLPEANPLGMELKKDEKGILHFVNGTTIEDALYYNYQNNYNLIVLNLLKWYKEMYDMLINTEFKYLLFDLSDLKNNEKNPLTIGKLIDKTELLLNKNINYDTAKFAITCGYESNIPKDCYPNLEIKNNNEYTPLMLASKNNKDIVKLLLDNGAQINETNFNEETPLIIATYKCNYDVVELLLDNGADINKTGNNKDTPLMIAIGENNYDVVELLLEKGADINKTGYKGDTPLSVAINIGNDDIVKLLLDNGADLDIADNNGNTPLSVAINKGYDDIVKLIKNKKKEKFN